MDVSSAKVIVTGGASGLGEATVRHFTTQGASVSLFDMDTERGQAVAQATGAVFVETDVTDERSVKNAVTKASTQMGGLSVCVNCAGIAIGERVVGREGPHRLDQYARVVQINLVGSFNVARLAAAEMARNAPDAGGQRGVIVNTASIAAFDGQKGQAAYASSKAGVAGLTLPAARDLASLGVRVMAIAPGLFLTPMLKGLGQEMVDTLAADVPFPRRLGDPSEFARLVAFIVDCDYLNGDTIRLDGALRMR